MDRANAQKDVSQGPKRKPGIFSSTFFLRVILGLLFLGAGLVKLADQPVFFAGLMRYELADANTNWLLSWIIPGVEVLLGIWLILGKATFFASLAGLALMMVFLLVLASAWARGLEVDCACFGPLQLGAGYPAWMTRNLVLCAIFGWLAWRNRAPNTLQEARQP